MFTGLINAICPVKTVLRPAADTRQITIDMGALAEDVKIGDSIAVNGVCLTVSKLQGTLVSFDLSGETLAKSNMGDLTPSSQVNVELALKASDRFGGHFVQGHVDGTAKIKVIQYLGQFANFTFASSPELLDQMAIKGSIAVNGISLTIAELDRSTFSVAVIPQTLKKTNLGTAKIGDVVNVETDIITKTIRKQIEKILPQKQGLTVERLKELGF
ncbi:MAG: riboflavin synthase [Planctomycetota bacterium]|jgi:riboflavin synthase